MIGNKPAPQPSRRRFALLGADALCLVAALAVLAAPALAAGKSQGRGGGAARIKVLSPAFDARVGGTLDARARVSTTAGFSASLAGHNVTKLFHRQGGVMEAHLRRGPDFDLGRNNLVIAAGNGRAMRATTVRFFSRSRAQGLLAVTRLDPQSDRTPLRFRISVSSPVAHLKVTVNHRRYRLGAIEGHRSWTIAVGAGDGLRYGDNNLRVSAERTNGTGFDHESLAFKVSRAAPLVSAGPDRLTRPGRGIVLDGGATQAGTRKGALLYRWQIVKQPRGSHAGIVDPTGKRARLMPDLPGDYKVRLVAARASKKVAAEATKTATASATNSTTPEPVCLPNLPVDLIPAADETGPSTSGSASEPLSPLEAPVCVTPTGETALTPLVPANVGATAADEMEVLAPATLSPMGLPIETIASDGSVRVGPQMYAKGAGFAHLLLLKDTTLTLESQEYFSLANASAMAAAVKGAGPNQIVVLTGMGQAQSEAPEAAQEALAEAVTALGGSAPASDKRAGIIESGRWSMTGIKGLPGNYASNLFGAGEQTPVEAAIGSLPGTLNGHLQAVKGGVFSYVSAEAVPIDTKAPGSSTLVSVFKVGEESVTGTVPSGSLGLHIAVFDNESSTGKLTALANNTYVIDNPYDNTNVQGVREAAEDLQHWREAPQNALIVMQTVGEEGVAPYTQPRGAQNWVNDALFHPTEDGLFEWHEQPYVKVKNESETEEVMDRFWNSEYPTVAGQVGDLTGPVGHDLVANFGNYNQTIEVTRLTMVASNHAQNPEANFITGDGEIPKVNKAEETQIPEGRLVGTLTRNSESGWTVQSASSAETFNPSKIWEIAYAEPTAWPEAQTDEQKEAMLGIAKQVNGPRTAVTNLRTLYPSESVEEARDLQEKIEEAKYSPTEEYTRATFIPLRKQLLTEVKDVIEVKVAIEKWKSIYGNQTGDLIQVNAVSSKVTQEVIHNAAKEKKTEVEVNPDAIIAESLYTASDVLGFPEVYAEVKIPEILGTLAGGVALAEASTPEAPETSEKGPESALIRAEADEIGTKLAEHVEAADVGLRQLEEILVSDWGKLEKAASEAGENWKLGKQETETLEQSLAINTERQLYEGVMPSAFEEWVISPYDTTWNPGGPVYPAKGYVCHGFRNDTPGFQKWHPLKDEPNGGVSAATYRPSTTPGEKVSPAQPYTLPYSVRALKSTSDRMTMQRVEVDNGIEAVTVNHDGSSPKASLVNHLFEPVHTGESRVNPSRLGMNKTEFFANYGGGAADWKRAICAEQ